MKGSFGKTEAPFRLLLHNEELLIVAMNDFPFSFPLPDHDVQRLRARILTTLCAADEGFCAIPVASIRRQTLAQMLDLYDILFFSGFLGRAYGEIDVTLSQRLTSSAGKFMYVRGGAARLSQAEIRMSGDFLFRLSEGPFLLNGLSVATPQEAFLVVFEHELCHAAENALFGSTRPFFPLSLARPRAVWPQRYAPQPSDAHAGGRFGRAFPRRAGLLLLSGQRVARNRHLYRKNGDGYGRRSKRRIPRSAGTALQQIPRSARTFDSQP